MSSPTHVSCGQFHMCFLVADTTESWRRREHGVARGSVQSQEWLGVLILSLVLMFQGPSFYHRLRSNNRGRKKIKQHHPSTKLAALLFKSSCPPSGDELWVTAHAEPPTEFIRPPGVQAAMTHWAS